MLSGVGWQDSAGKGWRWRGERRGSLVCFSVFSNPVATQFGVFLPLRFLALVCHSRKTDSKGQFPSRFNDPCDFFFWREMCPQRQLDLSPRPCLFQDPGEGNLHHHKCYWWQKARVETIRNQSLVCQLAPLACHRCLFCHTGEQRKK